MTTFHLARDIGRITSVSLCFLFMLLLGTARFEISLVSAYSSRNGRPSINQGQGTRAAIHTASIQSTPSALIHASALVGTDSVHPWWASNCTTPAEACLPPMLNLSDLPATWQAKVLAAADTWNAVGTKFYFHNTVVPDYLRAYDAVDYLGRHYGLRVAAGEVRVVQAKQINPQIVMSYTEAGGWADCPYVNGSSYSYTLYCLVVLNNEHWTFSIDDSPEPAELDLQSVALHELGHALGLGHSFNPLSVVFPIYIQGLSGIRRSLANEDTQRVIDIYGPVTPLLPPNTPILQTPSNGSLINQLRPAFAWYASSGASSYFYQIANCPNFRPSFSCLTVVRGETNSTSFTPSSDLVVGKIYYWRVKASDFGNNSDWSDVWWLQIGATTPTPSPPPPGPTPTPAPPGPAPTLPPGVDGIELVSVSSHVVRPGEQFYPSITIRRTSGYLDHARGDHLHAIPEDTSNTFGPWPVQEVKSYVGTGATYTFDVNNGPSFVMTAPSTPGQYQSVWQMRVGGIHIGPQAIIRITVQSDPIIPTPTPLPINCNDPPDGITLYEFTDFRGRCIPFTGDVMYLGNTYFGDDVASSLRIVGNWGATLFQDADWGGQWQEFSNSDANLSDDPIGDNRASSLRVWRPGDPCATLPQGVTLYRGRDFTGISQTFNQDASFLGNEPIGNDSVNSLRICGNYRVTLYRDADWSGQHQDFTGTGDSNLSDDPINDPNPTASSLRIIDASDACNTLPDGVTLYTQIDFGGQKQTFSSDVMFLGNTLIGDNAARSLRVCGHWVVTLFRDADWTGPWENFTGIDANLTDNPNSNPDPTASSLRMVDSFDFCRTLPPGATLYRGRDFTGIAQTFTSDASFLGNEPIGNDTVNSLRLCGYNARLFRDPDWQGFSEEFTGREESNLSDNPINDPNATTSSIRVWLKPPPTPTPTPTPIPTPTPWATKPDLVPFQGVDWPFPLLPSSVAGSRSVYTLYAGEITYLDWGIFNNSSVNVNTSFTITVYLDSVPIIQYPFDGINANSYSGFDDWQMIVGSTGYHTLKIVVDNGDTVSEVDESNNSWEGQFYWNPNPTPVLTNKVFLPLTLRNYTPVTADFAASPTYGTTPLTVTFINTSLGSYTASLWNFGDGMTSTLQNPTHVYVATGTYTVTLTVSDAGETSTLARPSYIAVLTSPPVKADFTASPTSGVAPLTVAFANASTGDYTSSLWDFGDGVTSTLQNSTHIYTATGVYTVSLIVSKQTGSVILPGDTDTLTRANYITVYTSTPNCAELVVNGGFETDGDWYIPQTAYPAIYTTTVVHSGNRSLRAGIVDPAGNVYSFSVARQYVTIPSNAQSAIVRFWLYPAITGASDNNDYQRVVLQDVLGNTMQGLVVQRSDARAWTPYQFELRDYAGQTIRLTFDVFNDGSGGVAAMYVDDVSLQVCPAP